MEYGTLLGVKTVDNTVEIKFDYQDVVVQVITDEILRVLVPCWKRDVQSEFASGITATHPDFEVTTDEGAVQIKTASVILHMWDDFGFVFTDKYHDEILTSFNGVRYREDAIPKNYKVQQLFSLGKQEKFYGLGDTPGFLNKRGYVYDDFNPFMLGKGPGYTYGLFFDNTFHTHIDLGKENEEYFFYGAADGNLDMYFMAGESIADVVRNYSYLTGGKQQLQRTVLGITEDIPKAWFQLQMLIPQLCNLGMSGFSITEMDMEVAAPDTNAELLQRWIQVACLGTILSNNCSDSQQIQDLLQRDEAVVSVYRKYVELHRRILPYIEEILGESKNTGLPVMRPLLIHYEYDENTYNLNNEFLVGENILVAPVVEQGATKRMVYLPNGTWVNYWTGEKHTGKLHFIEDAPIDVLPIYIREGSEVTI